MATAKAGSQLLHILNPTMAAVHDSGPDLAEECVLAMGTTLHNWGFTATTRLDGYARWLAANRSPRNTGNTGGHCRSWMPTTVGAGY